MTISTPIVFVLVVLATVAVVLVGFIAYLYLKFPEEHL